MLAYCDYIIALINTGLSCYDVDKKISTISPIGYDLGSNGELLSTKKTLEVTDMNGKKYRITVEEL